MRRLLLALALLPALFGAAFAQQGGNTTGLVVDTCGSPSAPFVSGRSGPFTIDTNGNLCGGSGTLAPGAATAANQALEITALNNIYNARILAGTPVAPGAATALQGLLIGCQYDAAAPTFTDGQQGHVNCGPNGSLNVTGSVGSGTTDAGNPVKVGGVYNTTPPTLTNGQRGDLQVGTRGSLNVTLFSQDATTTPIMAAGSADGVAPTQIGLVVNSRGYQYNGTTNDRAFTCTQSAVVNVTAGNTTQIVGLVAAQVVRVCGFAVSMSAAGTAQWVYGTGSNCGTGTTSLTGAVTLATGSPWTYSTGTGSVFRTASANALCLAAVTGNVTGVVTYAQF